MGLLGILVGLAILIALAFRGWSILLLAPIAALVTAMSPAVAVTFKLPIPTVPAETLLPIVTELPVSVRSPFSVEIGRLMLSVLAASDRPPTVSKLELVITCRPGSLAVSAIVALEAGRALIVRLPCT